MKGSIFLNNCYMWSPSEKSKPKTYHIFIKIQEGKIYDDSQVGKQMKMSHNNVQHLTTTCNTLFTVSQNNTTIQVYFHPRVSHILK